MTIERLSTRERILQKSFKYRFPTQLFPTRIARISAKSRSKRALFLPCLSMLKITLLSFERLYSFSNAPAFEQLDFPRDFSLKTCSSTAAGSKVSTRAIRRLNPSRGHNLFPRKWEIYTR